MITALIAIFVLGYVCIAMEHKIKVNKAATALVMFGLIWSVYAMFSHGVNIGEELMEHIGTTCETLLFLIGAMTIVELIDRHGGFYIITKRVKANDKLALLWIISIITFFMSAPVPTAVSCIKIQFSTTASFSTVTPRKRILFLTVPFITQPSAIMLFLTLAFVP